MAIKSYFFNAELVEGSYDRIYNADDICSYLSKIVGNGVFPNPSTCLQVVPASEMSVTVKAGEGWINGHKMSLTGDMTLTLDAADVLLDRIDEVIFFLDMTSRSMGVEILKGTPAAEPVPAALQRNADRWELCLARIHVAKLASAISAANISDTRPDSALCGYVQGLIQQISTTTLWEQFRDDFYTWFDAVRGQFDDFKRMTKLEYAWQNSIDYLTGFQIRTVIPAYNSAYDIVEVYVDGRHRSSLNYTLTNGYVAFEADSRPRINAEIDVVVYHMTPDSE